MSEQQTAEKTLRDFVAEAKKEMQCNCNLDAWQPEASTGHSHVCRIHRHAIGRYNAQKNGTDVTVTGVVDYD